MMSAQREPALFRRASWGAVLTVVTVMSTLALACATPFAALAAFAALVFPRRDAFVLIGVNWILSQAVGFGLLHYPLNWTTCRGGIDIGIAALACTGAAIAARHALRKVGSTPAVIGSFAAAFVIYEAAVFATSPWRSGADFSPSITLYILYINGLALVGLLILHSIATALGLTAPHTAQTARISAAP